LLKAIGGDCAGAVSLFEDGGLPPKPAAYSYMALTDDHLTKIIEELPENPFMADQKGIRLSLGCRKIILVPYFKRRIWILGLLNFGV